MGQRGRPRKVVEQSHPPPTVVKEGLVSESGDQPAAQENGRKVQSSRNWASNLEVASVDDGVSEVNKEQRTSQPALQSPTHLSSRNRTLNSKAVNGAEGEVEDEIQIVPQPPVSQRELGKTTQSRNICKITNDDIAKEVKYFENVVVCFFVGVNPPIMFLTGSLSEFEKTYVLIKLEW